jgi:hypothetical protein
MAHASNQRVGKSLSALRITRQKLMEAV